MLKEPPIRIYHGNNLPYEIGKRFKQEEIEWLAIVEKQFFYDYGIQSQGWVVPLCISDRYRRSVIDEPSSDFVFIYLTKY